MDEIELGRGGPKVSRVGLGCMGMSGMYGPADRAESIATIHQALDEGVTLIDTGDFYGMGHNEMLIGEALKGGKRDQAFISVKFGAQRGPEGMWLGYDARPAAVKTALAYTLQRLGVDHIDLYRPARLDPNVPIEDTVGAIADCIKAGWVRHLGLSEISAETLRKAHAVHPVSDVQFEYSIMSRGIERALLPAARELGVSITAYGILSRGLISRSPAGSLQQGDIRAIMPRFSGDNLAANQKLIEALEAVALAKGATPSQLAIAWVLARGPDVVPLIGARKRSQLTESLGALALDLTSEDLAAIEAAVPVEAVAGERYAAPQMATVER